MTRDTLWKESENVERVERVQERYSCARRIDDERESCRRTESVDGGGGGWVEIINGQERTRDGHIDRILVRGGFSCVWIGVVLVADIELRVSRRVGRPGDDPHDR